MNNKSLLAVAMVCATVLLVSYTDAPAHDNSTSPAPCQCNRYQFDHFTVNNYSHWRVFDTHTGEIWSRRRHDGPESGWNVWHVPGDE